MRREFVATKADRYEGIDGLKAYAIIGIALMHVLANGEYGIGGFMFERLIPSFTNLVFLFMMVSGFGMCCGYYQKIIDQKISVEDFYKKRYIKIWPYFSLLCALDFIVSQSRESLIEVFANFVTSIPKSFDPRYVFMILALVLFLLDVAVRKFKFKWPHEIVRSYKDKRKAKKGGTPS